MYDENENVEDDDLHIGDDPEMEDLDGINDFGLDEEDPDKDI